MQWSTKTRATVALVLHSASLNWVFWKSITRLPKALRLFTYSRVAASAASMTARPWMAMFSRSCGSCCHQLVEALPGLRPDQVLGRDADVVEEELGGVVALHADLVEVAPAAEALRVVGLHDEQGVPLAPWLGSVLATTMMKLAVWPLVMKVLDPLTTYWLPSSRAVVLTPCRSEPAPGLGHGDGAHVLAADQLGQPAPLLLLGAVVDDVGGHDGVVQADAPVVGAVAAQLLHQHGLVAVVAAHAAVFLGRGQAQQPGLGAAGPQLARHHPRLAPALRLRGRGVVLQEAVDGVGEDRQLLVAPGGIGNVERRGVHQNASAGISIRVAAPVLSFARCADASGKIRSA
jgi:hypothetical protein